MSQTTLKSNVQAATHSVQHAEPHRYTQPTRFEDLPLAMQRQVLAEDLEAARTAGAILTSILGGGLLLGIITVWLIV